MDWHRFARMERVRQRELCGAFECPAHVRAGESFCRLRQRKIIELGDWLVLRQEFDNLEPRRFIRRWHEDRLVETARPPQRWIELPRRIRRADHQDALIVAS